MALISVAEAPYNAAGDGSTNDTSAIQSAIDDASEGDCIVFPRGTWETDTLAIPSSKSLTILGEGPQATRIRVRTNDTDLFKSDRGTSVAEDRFTSQHVYENFTAVMRTSGSDTAPSFNRCTVGGLPIGCAAIAYERANLPSSTSNGNDEGWPNTFGVVRNVIFEDNNTTSGGTGSNSCGVYISGSAYGWTLERLWYHDIDFHIVMTAPFIRRCSVDAGTDTLTYTVDNSFAYPANAEVTIMHHTGAGSLSGGLTRHDDYFVRSPTTGTLQLSTSSGGSAVNITSSGTAPLYVSGRDDYAGGAIAPDGVSIDKITAYSGKVHISIINPENLAIGRTDSYQITGNLLELRGFPSASRTYPISCTVENMYSESPQTSAPLSTDQNTDPFVYIDGRGVSINHLQFRGRDGTSNTRPVLQLAGLGNKIGSIYALSSFSQAQPDLWVSGNGCKLEGLAHGGARVFNSGSSNTIEVINESSGSPGTLHSINSGSPT